MRMSSSMAYALMRAQKPAGDDPGGIIPQGAGSTVPTMPTTTPVPAGIPLPMPAPGPVPPSRAAPSPAQIPAGTFVSVADFKDFQDAVRQSMNDMAKNLNALQDANNQLVSAINAFSGVVDDVSGLKAAVSAHSKAIVDFGDLLVKGFRPAPVNYQPGKTVKVATPTKQAAAAAVVDSNPSAHSTSSGTSVQGLDDLLSPEDDAF
jgi:hypothetical protein